jgi:hypothetical protein
MNMMEVMIRKESGKDLFEHLGPPVLLTLTHRYDLDGYSLMMHRVIPSKNATLFHYK